MKGKVAWDPDLEFLVEHFTLIDTQLDKIDQKAENSPDPDSFGIFDTAESVTGLGFVACQRYLAATSGWVRINKRSALALGPRHPSGMTIPQIINHAANFWKHQDDWRIEKNSKAEVRTREALEKVGVSTKRSYVLSNVLAMIAPSKPERFRTLIPILTAWREELNEMRLRK